MKILLSNDDGVNAKGIAVYITRLQKLQTSLWWHPIAIAVVQVTRSH